MSGKEIRAKILYETKRLAYIMVEVNEKIMVSMIVDNDKKAVVGVGVSRREAFECARNVVEGNEELEKELEELELQ